MQGNSRKGGVKEGDNREIGLKGNKKRRRELESKYERKRMRRDNKWRPSFSGVKVRDRTTESESMQDEERTKQSNKKTIE